MGDRDKYAHTTPFLDALALAKKGGPAQKVATCRILATCWAPVQKCAWDVQECSSDVTQPYSTQQGPKARKAGPAPPADAKSGEKRGPRDVQECASDVTTLLHPAQAESEKSQPSASSDAKSGPAPMGDRDKYANTIPFLDALATKGGPAQNTAISCVLGTLGSSAKVCIRCERVCIGHDTTLLHPAQAESEKSRPSASSGCQKRVKAGPRQWVTETKTQIPHPFWTRLPKKVAQHKTPLFALF